MAWTAPSDKVTGDVVTAAMWNASLGATGNMAQTAAAKVTTAGDITYATGANALARLAIGSSAQVLTVTGGLPAWATAAGGFSLAGSNTTEATMTSATAADLVTVSGLSIPVTTPFMIMFGARKSGGVGSELSLGLKINSTIIFEAVMGNGRLVSFPSTNEAQNGQVVLTFGARYTNYENVITGTASLVGATGSTRVVLPSSGVSTLYAAPIPLDTITSITIRGDSDGTNTLGIRGVFVYTLGV